MLHTEPRPAPPSVSIDHAIRVKGGVLATPDSARAGAAKFERKPPGVPFGSWVEDVLCRNGGVLAALPRAAWPSGVMEASSTLGRIVALDSAHSVGCASWWLGKLRESKYQHDTAYRGGGNAATYSTDGIDQDENSWFPTTQEFDPALSEDEMDKLTLAGFSVTVRSTASGEGTGIGHLPELQQRILLELEAAAVGTGPAVFATKVMQDEQRTTVCVGVTQTHSFRLKDMLMGFNHVLGDPVLRPQLSEAEAGVYEATAAVARKLRTLANLRILKLNVTPDTVVFCPRLHENDETGTLDATGYGFVGLKAARGVPFIADFDPTTTKRVSSQTPEYDADCAYVAMTLVLLSTTRAAHGELAAKAMLQKLTGKGIDNRDLGGDALPANFDEISLKAAAARARDKAVAFGAVVRSVLPSFQKEHALVLTAAYDDVATDLAAAVQPGALEEGASEKPVFGKLVRHLLGSRRADTSLFAAPVAKADLAMDREVAHRVEQRVAAV